MEVRQLRYLVAAVQCGSLGKAASELGLATSAISQQISRLEGELSTRLLIRGTTGVVPTEAGAAFCQHAALALRHIDAASAAARNARLAGIVSIGLAPTTASILAMPLIESMARRYPNIRLQLVEGMSGHLAGMLKARQIDLAVLFNAESVTFARGEAIPLLDESLFLVGAPPAGSEDMTGGGDMAGVSERDPVSLTEIAGLPLILPSRGHGLRASLDRAFASANVRPNIVMEIDSLSVIMEAVSSGIGYTIQPGAAFSRAAPGAFNVRPLGDRNIFRANLLASLPEHELSPAALALRAQLRKMVGVLVREGRWIGVTLHDP